ncbi:EAL domain-containing protein [Neobacillus sp. NPDC058068]|uniref:EAL domain-containing protein n=1 Tax=Neobacillus sp. NPDC058068 TaxID=3346325 RepID=UPI0036DD3F72
MGQISDVLIQNIEHVYQPMWNVDAMSIFGYEALLRFPDGYGDGNIEQVFAAARTDGTLYELDTRSFAQAISRFPLNKLAEGLLFLNLYPSTLLHPHFPFFMNQLVKTYPFVCGRVVIELNETKEEESCWELPEFKKRILLVKDLGFAIALDDVGTGATGLQKIIEFSPNYIKLDRYFSVGLSSSTEKQQMVALLIQYAQYKMGVILEGIEEEDDLAAAINIDVPIIQGYLLGKPKKMTAQTVFRKYQTSLKTQHPAHTFRPEIGVK